MKRTSALAVVFLLFLSGAFAQEPDSSSQATPPPPPPPSRSQTQMVSPFDVPAFSRVSFGAGISPLGIGLQVSTALNQHLNLRGVGNIFNYGTSFTMNGIPVKASLALGSGGAMVDYYPFHKGFRASGGVLFINEDGASASASVPGGESITLDNQTYYSANTNAVTGATPLAGTGGLSLNALKPTPVLTTGWGNHVRRSGHWDFPVEVGVAFIGQPKVTMALTGWACVDAAQTNCANVASSSNPISKQFQTDLNAQIAKWNSDLNGLSVYPVLSIGVAYSFQTRSY